MSVEASMPVWLLEHKSPKAANNGKMPFERDVVRAGTQAEARDLAVEVTGVSGLEEVSPWSDYGKTVCERVADGDSYVIAVEMWDAPRRGLKKSLAG
jgi:hypothetical protein